MIKETDFKTFLYISKKKYQIFVYHKSNSKNLYNEEMNINEDMELNNLLIFLDKNIFKIEKKINNFINDVILIVEDEKIFNTNIGIKKKNYEKLVDQKYLENNLTEIKDIFRENYQNQIIMHMIIINDDYLCLEVNFISIPNSFTFIFDKLLENHQIKIERYMSASYIKSFFAEDKTELSLMAKKIYNGLNKNEVKLVSRNKENKGFFERFFQLFS